MLWRRERVRYIWLQAYLGRRRVLRKAEELSRRDGIKAQVAPLEMPPGFGHAFCITARAMSMQALGQGWQREDESPWRLQRPWKRLRRRIFSEK